LVGEVHGDWRCGVVPEPCRVAGRSRLSCTGRGIAKVGVRRPHAGFPKVRHLRPIVPVTDAEKPTSEINPRPSLRCKRWHATDHPPVPVIPGPAAISHNVGACRNIEVLETFGENAWLPGAHASFPDADHWQAFP